MTTAGAEAAEVIGVERGAAASPRPVGVDAHRPRGGVIGEAGSVALPCGSSALTTLESHQGPPAILMSWLTARIMKSPSSRGGPLPPITENAGSMQR